MSECSNRLYVPRADFEMSFGVEVDPKAIGALLTTHDGETILLEYLFMERAEEVKILENLYAMSEG